MWKSSFLLLSLFIVTYCTKNSISVECDKKEKTVVFLEVAKESILKAKELYPNCSSNDLSNQSNYCVLKEKSFVYLDLAENMISEAVKNYPSFPEPLSKKYADCSDVLDDGHKASGIYKVWLNSANNQTKPVDVFCDMVTDGGGWTVIQRRGKFSIQQEFYRGWDDYKVGFGNITEEFWLGNENIFILTNQGSYTARFDLKDSEGSSVYAWYQSFLIEDENEFYKLHITGYSGNAGDSLEAYSNNVKFSTKDKMNDGLNCAKVYHGAWWYKNYGREHFCTWSNLNGLYIPGDTRDSQQCYWYHWKNNKKGLASSEIKLRRKN